MIQTMKLKLLNWVIFTEFMTQTPTRQIFAICVPGRKPWVFREHAPNAPHFSQLWVFKGVTSVILEMQM